jgi:hypothetical protein
VALDRVVRRAVATADKLTKSLQVPITMLTHTFDFEGSSTATKTTKHQGFVERRKQLRRNDDGQMVELDERVLMLGSVDVDAKAELSDDLGRLGPVIYVGGFRDPAGGTYYTEVWCGSSRGTSLGTG